MTRDEAGRWLKPCPFCGGEAEVVSVAFRDGGYVEYRAYVRCRKCGATTYELHKCMTADEVKRNAADMWNRRAERTCSLVFVDDGEGHAPNVRCSACGRWLDAVADVESVALFEFCPLCGARVERGEA